MADQSLSLYSETTVIEDTDLIAIRKDSSDSVWRYMTGASLKASALDSLSVSGTTTVAALNSQESFTEIADDGVATIAFDGDAQGIVFVSAKDIGGGIAIAYVRIGTSPQSAVLASSLSGGGSVVATTGALTGTTGSDGNLTISCHTDNNLYVENRSGGARKYQLAFVAFQGSNVSSL